MAKARRLRETPRARGARGRFRGRFALQILARCAMAPTVRTPYMMDGRREGRRCGTRVAEAGRQAPPRRASAPEPSGCPSTSAESLPTVHRQRGNTPPMPSLAAFSAGFSFVAPRRDVVGSRYQSLRSGRRGQCAGLRERLQRESPCPDARGGWNASQPRAGALATRSLNVRYSIPQRCARRFRRTA